MKNSINILLTIALFSSCQQTGSESLVLNGGVNETNSYTHEREVLTPSAYVAWLQDPENGLIQDKTVGDMKFTALYKTPDYMICQEERSDAITKGVHEQKMAELEDMEYFDIKLELTDGQKELLKESLKDGSEYVYSKLF